jgi:hypothetical protein
MKEYLKNLRKLVGHMPILVCGGKCYSRKREG